jgi:hypothetical protein
MQFPARVSTNPRLPRGTGRRIKLLATETTPALVSEACGRAGETGLTVCEASGSVQPALIASKIRLYADRLGILGYKKSFAADSGWNIERVELRTVDVSEHH